MVNFEKSSIYTSPRLDPIMRQLLIDMLGVRSMERTNKYLGKQILLPAARISSYADLIERCTQKLAAWKANSLSHAGRMVLLKSSLASIPIYMMGTSLLPKGVSLKLQQLQRQFWWGNTREKKKLCLIKWETISKPKKEGGLGVRNPELINISLISKLVWRFLTVRNSHWSRIMATKYLRNNSFWDARKPYVCSPMWKSMIHCRDLIKPGVCWSVGDGTNIHIWHDPWISTIPGFRAIAREGVNADVTWVVELFITGTKIWNTTLLQQIFEPHISDAIIRIEVPSDATEDKLLWIPHSKGIFTAKSMYKQLTIEQPSSSNQNRSSRNINWSKLWQVKGIAPRVLMFLWRALHGGLAVGARLKRIMGTDGICKECNQHEETTDHMLFYCRTASTVWQRAGLLDKLHLYDVSTLNIFAQLLELDLDDFRHGCAIIWMLWIARNMRVFNGKHMVVNEILHRAQNLYKEYKDQGGSSLSNPVGVHDQQLHLSAIKWSLPRAGFVKINIDGAHRGGLGAAGAIARDAEGRFLGGMAKASFPGQPIQAEAQGFLLAINLVTSLNLGQTIIESDSKLIVDALHNHDLSPDWRIDSTLNACRVFQRSRTDVIFAFTPRECNKAAHALAAFALSHDVTTSWNGGLPPPFLLDVLFADMAHIVTTNVINE